MNRNVVFGTLGRLIGAVLVLLLLVSRGLFAQASTFQVSSGQPWIDVTAQGAYLDGQTTCTASISGTNSPFTVSASAGTFDSAFLGEEVWMQVATTGASVAVGTITGIPTVVPAGSEVYVTTPTGAPTPTAGPNLCVTWGHDDVYALQASLNLLAAAPFNGVGGEIKIPHGKTGLMMVGQQVVTANGSSKVAGVSIMTLAPGQTFGSTVGATVTINGCQGVTSFNGTYQVSGWNPSTGEIFYNQNGRSTNDKCTNATITETGVYAPTQQAYVIEAESKTGSNAAASGAELLGGFTGGYILNVGERGTNLNPAPRIQGLQFQDVSGTGASPGGLLCIQCLNGEFVGLSFTNFDGRINPTGTTIYMLSAGLELSSSETGGDWVTTGADTNPPQQIFQPNTEINSIYDIRCLNDSVCIDAGSTIGSDQDGPHVYGGYIQVANNLYSSSSIPNTQTCTGIWAAGPLRYYGGLVEVGATTSTQNCLGIWSTGGASDIIGKFEQHGTNGTGVYINPGPTATVSGSQITGMQRDSKGTYVNVTLSGPPPFTVGQVIQVTNTQEAGYNYCTFDTVTSPTSDQGKAVVASVSTVMPYGITYLQPCAADPGGMATAVTGKTITVQGFPVSSDSVQGPMYNFYAPVWIGAGAINNTIRITPSSTANTLGAGGNPEDVVDYGAGTVFTVTGSSSGQVMSEISAVTVPPATVDLFDICAATTPPTTCSSPGSFFRADSASNIWFGATGTNTNVGAIKVSGTSSGSVLTIQPQSTGSPTINLPTGGGTFAVSASSPLSLDGTGNLTCTNCVTVSGGGNLSATPPLAISGSNISINGSAGGVLAGSGATFTATPTLGLSGTSGSITLVGGSGGSATLAVSSSGGTLQLGSNNATITNSGNLSIAGNFTSTASSGFTGTATESSAPATPTSGNEVWWFDRTDHMLHSMNSTPTIGTTAVSNACGTNTWIYTMSTAGVFTCSQPTLDQIGNLAAAKIFADGIWPLSFNSATAAASQTAVSFGETTAATGTGDIEVGISTASGSTSEPLQISQGAGKSGSPAPNVETITGGAGGPANGTTSPGNTGGGWSLTAGNGSSGGSTSGNGGAGGPWTLTTGSGGAATGGSNSGGSGGGFNVTTGNGANGGSSSTSGNGGNAVFMMGVGGTTGTAGSSGEFEVTGTAPASQSSAGISVGTIFNVAGVTGGATSSTANNTGGTGSSATIAAGNGGAATGSGTASTTGGLGGSLTFTAGAGGAGSAGNDSGGAGGNIILTPGLGGAKSGSGTAGSPGAVTASAAAPFNFNLTNTVNTAVAYSPTLYWDGTYQSGSSSYALDYWTAQDVVGSGINGTSTLTFGHGGTSGAAGVSIPTLSLNNPLTVSNGGTGQSHMYVCSIAVTGLSNSVGSGDQISAAGAFNTGSSGGSNPCQLPSSIPAGSTLDIFIGGNYTTPTSGSPTMTFTVSIAGTPVLLNGSNVAPNTSIMNQNWIIQGRVIFVTSTGSSCTTMAIGTQQLSQAAGPYSKTGGLNGGLGTAVSIGVACQSAYITVNETATLATGQYFNLNQMIITLQE